MVLMTSLPEWLFWSPGILDGFIQTEGYARTVLTTELAATAEQVAARLASRIARQQRVLYRQDPPRAWFVVDEFSLYRLVGSPEVMASQMRHLLEAESVNLNEALSRGCY